MTEINTKKSKLSLYEKQNRTALISITGVGRKTFHRCTKTLYELGMTWDDFWANKDGVWEKCCINKKTSESIINFLKEYKICSYWEGLLEKNIAVVDELEISYPRLLFEIDDRPPILFVKGNFLPNKDHDFLWNQRTMAVVGTRKMTSYGKFATQKIVGDLLIHDIVIVSGFMYGVDVWAQQTVMKGGGNTIAVLGFGFDNIFPKYQKKLMDEMIDQGAVFLTEYPAWISPSPNTFPTRNRIVAGLSKGVVVIEAGQKSGSHITAQCALDYGREVFAVPGPISNPYSQGTKDLIKQGATMISSGQEIIEEMGWNYEADIKCSDISGKNVVKSKNPTIEARVLAFLQSGNKEIDAIIRETGFSADKVAGVISKLEIEEKITNSGGQIGLYL